jgi:predicted nucleotidyltransferase
MSLDFSANPELRGLERVAGALQAVAAPLGVEFFLMGAAARDLMLRHAHGIEAPRATEDVDFAMMVRDWQAYDVLRTALIASGEFSERPGPATHRLRHTSGLPLDIVPFGGIERADRTFAWPPEHRTVFNCFGVAEAFAASIAVRLSDAVELRVAPIAAQAVLKLSAWQDRKHTHPGRDAADLLLFLGRYMDCGNFDRAASEHQDLFEAEDFDYAEAGVRLLARDIAPLIGGAGIERMMTILTPEADEARPLLLAQQSGLDREHARRLLAVLRDEFASAM